MAQRISAALNVSHEALNKAGIFDRFVDIDSQLHVDPHLLASSRAAEIAQAANTLDSFWADTITVLSHIFDYGDRFWRESVKRFTFPEIVNTGLGYALKGTGGSAVGKGLAKNLVETARQIVKAGVHDPKIFELVGLLEPNIGPDLISDITVHIIERHLLEFTARISTEIGIECREFTVNGVNYSLPSDPDSRQHLILLPKDILRDLPVAFCWADIDVVCAYNDALRAKMNGIIGDTWRRVTEDNTKQKIKEVLVANPAVLTDLLQQYRAKPGQPYDFVKDTLGETIWLEAAQEIANAYPLNLRDSGPITVGNVLETVRKICNHFRQLVEDNGLCKVFWTDEGEVRHERLPQLLFFAIADSYCRANDLDLSPEVNSGRGPVDFKVSKGYSARVLVEVKWSKNSKLMHGFETQVEQYAKAERTDATILLVIQVSESRNALDRLEAAQGEAIRAGKRTPD